MMILWNCHDDFWFDQLHDWMINSNCKSSYSILIMFVIGILGSGSSISLFILSIQMLVERNGFDFESIESSILWQM